MSSARHHGDTVHPFMTSGCLTLCRIWCLKTVSDPSDGSITTIAIIREHSYSSSCRTPVQAMQIHHSLHACYVIRTTCYWSQSTNTTLWKYEYSKTSKSTAFKTRDWSIINNQSNNDWSLEHKCENICAKICTCTCTPFSATVTCK